VAKLCESVLVSRPDNSPTPARPFSACGFPEPEHLEPALAIYERFAKETGFEWVGGGVSISGGESLHGKPLAEAGGQARHMRAALDMAARAFAAGQPVPAWLYALGGNWGWRRQARRNRVKTPLTHRPHSQ